MYNSNVSFLSQKSSNVLCYARCMKQNVKQAANTIRVCTMWFLNLDSWHTILQNRFLLQLFAFALAIFVLELRCVCDFHYIVYPRASRFSSTLAFNMKTLT